MNRENTIGLVGLALLLAALVVAAALCLAARGGPAEGSAEEPAERATEETREETWEETREPLPTVQPPRPPQPGEAARGTRSARQTAAGSLKPLAAVRGGPAEDDPEDPAVCVAYGAADIGLEPADGDAAEDTGGAAGAGDTAEDTAGAGGEMVFIGEYQIYGYDLCAGCCGKTDGVTASGTAAAVGRTAACASLPYGKHVYIEGIGERVIEDTGALADNVIDVLCADHAGCYAITGRRAVYQITGPAA